MNVAKLSSWEKTHKAEMMHSISQDFLAEVVLFFKVNHICIKFLLDCEHCKGCDQGLKSLMYAQLWAPKRHSVTVNNA